MTPRYWWPLLIVLFLLGIYLQVYLLSAFALMLGTISLGARWWARHALHNISYTRRLYYRRAFPGEIIPLTIETENRKFLPLSWLFVKDPWPKAVGPEDENILARTHLPETGLLINLFSLRWYERARRYYQLLYRKRGVYELGPARLESGDIFGIFSQTDENGPIDQVTVFPKPLSLAAMDLPAGDPFGDRRTRRRLHEDPNLSMGIRDYRPEDDFRRIHWPATAHSGELQVKVYQPVTAQVMSVCLNVSTFQYYWQGVDPDLLERLVSASAGLVEKALQDGYRVGMISNGCLMHSDQPFRISPGRSPDQLGIMMSALAAVTPFVTAPFERLLLREVHKLPPGTLLLILTSIVSMELRETLLQLKRHSRPVSVLAYCAKPPLPIPGIRMHHIPYEA
ncbi:MAG TPA: DUF58 domain-containing protein [Anaerolineales bacterium]|nr:DUF58 domain-containing protein [Anaerolineales bacterium]